MSWLARLLTRWACANTSLVVDVVKLEGFHPQVRLTMSCKHMGHVLGVATFNPDQADAFAAVVGRLSGNVRHWIEGEAS